MRIFNVFGVHEYGDRMVKNSIHKNLRGEPFEINQDRVMDFFSSYDLFKVVEHYINNFIALSLYKDLNLCYANKIKLSDLCQEIQKNGTPTHIIFHEEGDAPAYCGSSERLDSLNIELIGLEKSITTVYRELKERT
jgi:nucleoside-diphosphate-sugar epimerase